MAVEIKFTGAGESITNAVVLKWLKPDGSAVKNGDAVVELETDKASKEEYAPSAGVLSIKAQPGARVDVGAVLGLIDPDGKPTAAAPDANPAAPALTPGPACPRPPA
jgi:2-oxoglutarate dehydrogenase E2 component (dihydrolipoamide succinyltransferase)